MINKTNKKFDSYFDANEIDEEIFQEELQKSHDEKVQWVMDEFIVLFELNLESPLNYYFSKDDEELAYNFSSYFKKLRSEGSFWDFELVMKGYKEIEKRFPKIYKKIIA